MHLDTLLVCAAGILQPVLHRQILAKAALCHPALLCKQPLARHAYEGAAHADGQAHAHQEALILQAHLTTGCAACLQRVCQVTHLPCTLGQPGCLVSACSRSSCQQSYTLSSMLKLGAQSGQAAESMLPGSAAHTWTHALAERHPAGARRGNIKKLPEHLDASTPV